MGATTTGRGGGGDGVHPWASAALAGDWVSWPGLPARLGEEALLRRLGRAAAAHPHRPALLGRRQADLVELERLRYWLSDGQVALVELEDPASMLAPAALLSALGEPDRTSAGRYRRFGATTTEHVYAARGLAVTVAESYDDPPTFEPLVAAVLLFAPTDLRGFVLELGGDDRGGPRL
jgi:hypothetical protein